MLRRGFLAGLGALALAGCEQTASGSGLGARWTVVVVVAAIRIGRPLRRSGSVTWTVSTPSAHNAGLSQLAFSQALKFRSGYPRAGHVAYSNAHGTSEQIAPTRRARAVRAGYGGPGPWRKHRLRPSTVILPRCKTGSTKRQCQQNHAWTLRQRRSGPRMVP